jgi:hypothetical protein
MTAVFSTRPWQPGAFDRTEDTLHSVAATAMGFAFAIGVLATFAHARWQGTPRRGALDAVAVGASVLLPLGMAWWSTAGGVLQRVMFLIAYLWYAGDVFRHRTSSRRTSAA